MKFADQEKSNSLKEKLFSFKGATFIAMFTTFGFIIGLTMWKLGYVENIHLVFAITFGAFLAGGMVSTATCAEDKIQKRLNVPETIPGIVFLHFSARAILFIAIMVAVSVGVYLLL